jgi:hypothetical protein
MRHSRSKDFLRAGQGVIFVPPILDRPTIQQRSMAVSAPPPPPGTHNVKGKLFLIVERCNGVVNHVLIQNDKRRIICCVYDDVKTYIVLRNAFRSSNLNNGTGFENSAIVCENL